MAYTARSIHRMVWIVGLTLSFLANGCGVPAHAERGHGFEHGRFYSPHWELDGRHGHEHFYPAVGYYVPNLPPGYLDLTFGGGHFFFRSGVWFRAEGAQYVVVRPPIGIRLGLLPPAYSTLTIGGLPYYYANGVYYAPAPDGVGYAVVEPPSGYDSSAPSQSGAVPSQAVPSSPANAFGAPAASLPQSLFVYPRQGQTHTQMTTDRNDCNAWGTSQTGYDPTRSGMASAQQGSDFQRAVKTCLEGKGYTVN